MGSRCRGCSRPLEAAPEALSLRLRAAARDVRGTAHLVRRDAPELQRLIAAAMQAAGRLVELCARCVDECVPEAIREGGTNGHQS